MRITIIGGGDIGFQLAVTLAPDHDIFVVDTNVTRGERFGHLDVEFLRGSGTNPEVLRRAGAVESDLLIAATRLDEVNIVACSIASQLGTRETVCFVTKEDFLKPPGGVESLREHFGIGRVVWPEARLARAIERIIMAPGAIDAGDFADGRIRLLQFRLDETSPLVATQISALDLPHGVVIAAVKHEDSTSIPHGTTRLAPGDKAVLMGTREAMTEMQRRLAPRTQAKGLRVTIIGGGDVGYQLAQHLESTRGVELRVIERDRARGEMLAATLKNALVLEGDGTDLELLESEEIGRSDVLVSVIDNDERNLLALLLGRQLGVGKIITRVSTLTNLRLFERVGIDVALTARGAAVQYLVHEIDGGRTSLLAVLEEGEAKVVEFRMPQDRQPTAIRDLGLPPDSIVGTILRGGTVVVPGGDDVVQGGDRLLVCGTAAAVRQVRDMFGSSA